MVIILNVSFPAESAKKVGECFLNVSPIPDYMTRRGPYLSSNNMDGVKSLSIFEVDNARLADGLLAVGEYVTAFFDVPGFAYDIDACNEIEEGLKMIGLA
jgi:hypothetical protein